MDIKSVFENTTPEQRQRAFECKTAEELKQFAKDENIGVSAEDLEHLFAATHKNTGEISDDDLDNVAGGKEDRVCPECGSSKITLELLGTIAQGNDNYLCWSCGWTFWV